MDQKPFFLSAYFASFDESAHQYGVYSREAARSLEKIDAMLGQLIEEAERITQGDLVVCVVSDHGTLDNHYNISPNVLLHQAGLIELDPEGNVTSWKAWSQRAGGTAEVRMADPQDEATRRTLEGIMKRLTEDPDSGILEVVDREGARARGGFPDAEYVLVAKKGYELRDDVTGDYCRTRLTQKAQHGYSENFPEMRASFMLWGKGVRPGSDPGEFELIDIAPTLAAMMGVSLPDAEGVNRLA
ncbi:alkaline phosphatase family protein [Faecalibacterium sp. An122]|uniref:alkaline phosphatase family protein n=1 Tax=Faecalibacterium sp. An122 TaxID=1965551 RepID=UPI0023B8C9C3|nr:alkaline phosphatase family protein [Faecalibacterium sp. An122]